MISRKPLLLLLIILIAGASFLTGWGLGKQGDRKLVDAEASNNLRAEGGKFTRPLLLTGIGDTPNSESLTDLESDLNEEIGRLKQAGKASDVSVFYRSGGNQLQINSEEKYFPASLSKVPLMMTYFKLAESDPQLLVNRGRLEFDVDYNSGQEIVPSKSPTSGQEYSTQELIEMMIKNSDNIGFNLLMTNPGTSAAMKAMFEDLQLFYPYEQAAVKEVITAREFSRFFRVLYNATYLNEEFSERALELLSEVEYKNGLVAGVGQDITVSHKFGLNTHRDLNNPEVVLERQLHDCGIIYYPDDPYTLCIMTKSKAVELEDVEHVLQQISKTVYDYVDKK